MKTTNRKKAAMQKTLESIGSLIEEFRKDNRTSFAQLTAETGMHYNTFRKVTQGDPDCHILYTWLAIAELMQHDTGPGTPATDRFFHRLRSVLDDAFDEV